MKKVILLLIFSLSSNLFSQVALPTTEEEKRSCVTIGILQGGGSLVGADVEFLLTNRLGFQLGAGLLGFGAGLNYHFKPSIKSDFISFQYWNQGIGQTFTQNVLGLTYVYRGKKWFTCQLGLGAPLSQGPAYPENIIQPPIMLMYSIGGYIPISN